MNCKHASKSVICLILALPPRKSSIMFIDVEFSFIIFAPKLKSFHVFIFLKLSSRIMIAVSENDYNRCWICLAKRNPSNLNGSINPKKILFSIQITKLQGYLHNFKINIKRKPLDMTEITKFQSMSRSFSIRKTYLDY